MKKRNKFGLLALGLVATTFIVSGCTANFCTNKEKGKIAYALESGVTQYYYIDDQDYNDLLANSDYNLYLDEEVVEGSKIHKVVRINNDGKYEYANNLNTIISNAKSSGILAPKTDYLVEIDNLVFTKIIEASGFDLTKTTQENPGDYIHELYDVLNTYGGAIKFNDNNKDVFNYYKELSTQVCNDLFDRDEAADQGHSIYCSEDFKSYYVSSMNSLIESYRACITTNPGYKYGNYGINRLGETVSVGFEKTTWGQAWKKGGRLIEGLVVYPVAWMLDGFAVLFAKNSGNVQTAYSNGYPQLLSLILVTIIVRLFIFLVTIKSTLSQQKMNELQPELAKIQQKYPNSNTSQVQKQRLAEEQMRLYKKNGVNPLSSLLVLIIQFPVFIGVWGAMTGSAVLSTGSIWGLSLSQSIWEVLKNVKHIDGTWFVALGLILLMSASQFFSMKVPQWIQKAKTKKVAKLGANPAQKQQNKTANIVSYVMLIMIIIMGFTLPAAMGIYWFIGALVSLLQTLLTNFITSKKKHNK